MISVDREPPSSTTAMPTTMQYRVSVLTVSIWSASDKPMYTTARSLPFCWKVTGRIRHGALAVTMAAWLALAVGLASTLVMVSEELEFPLAGSFWLSALSDCTVMICLATACVVNA